MNAWALTVEKYRVRFFDWRVNQSWVVKLIMAAGFAVLIGLAAHVKILTPLSPVAFSLSTAVVLLGAVLLGRRWGAVAVSIYATMAFLGLPVMTTAVGITFGYVIGFFASMVIVGYLIDKVGKSRSFWAVFAIMTTASVVILLCGTLWMWAWMGTQLSLSAVFGLAFVPFLLTDLLKSVAVAAITTTILPNSK